MTQSHDAHGHSGPGFKAYMMVFGALSVFTVVSFVVNYLVRHGSMAPESGFAVILAVAVVKATLVGMYFMHLVVDWGKLYYMIIPAFILGVLLIVVLMPDIVLAWSHSP